MGAGHFHKSFVDILKEDSLPFETCQIIIWPIDLDRDLGVRSRNAPGKVVATDPANEDLERT